MLFNIEIGLIVLFSIIGGVLAVRFKQPSVLGLILIGAIIGPYSLGLIKDTSIIESAIEIGAILLMFMVGIEFSLDKLLNLGFRVIIASILKIGVAFGAVFYIATLLGFGTIASLYLAVMLSITSTVILIKILEQKGLAKGNEFTFLVAILILEDLFGVFALTFFSGLNTTADLKPLNLIIKIIISLAIMAFSYLAIKKILRSLMHWLLKYSAEETFVFISFGVCGGLAYLASAVSLSASVGAFLAGNIVSSFPGAKKFEKSIHPFALMFTALFFFSVGTTVNFSTIMSNWFVILILFIAWMLIVLFAISFGAFALMNFDGKKAVLCGLAMIPIGEFSLLIAKEASGLNLGVDLVSIIAGIILLSSLTMSLIVNRYETIYLLIKKIIPSKAITDTKNILDYFNTISLRMKENAAKLSEIKMDRHRIFINLVIILAGSFFFAFLINNTNWLDAAINRAMAVIILAIVVIIPLFLILRATFALMGVARSYFINVFPMDIKFDKKIFRHLIINSVLILLVIFFPVIYSFYDRHVGLHIIFGLFLFFTIVYTLRSISLLHRIAGHNMKKVEKLSKKFKKGLVVKPMNLK